MEARIDFDERPFIVIWETTQACDLACVHCRACAQPLRSQLELNTTEARHLIDDVAALRTPVFALTGGDPLKRYSPLFTSLRDTANLQGKCGICEFREVCGGSRARAYALTGNIFAEEPCCIWQPRTQLRSAGSQPNSIAR